ncbi:hypothetical protein [Brenneria corticis]|uniref:AP2 domain-containing protein n=1 Tax=Brenneria corticis TaxID=2173106 RepID=A0A2U1TM61_9GAMM|nr:hypothetical protein [Brenneria sp. CFCC 11842]PWC10508.1 hypothetical protein DDT56_21580 [Brenneria sp. CFCC 11842]
MKREQHGMTNMPEYRVWTDMRTRCNNPHSTEFENYGGCGISVCAAWDSFSQFYSDMGPRPSSVHTIERRDVNGNYEPSKCCWVTRAEQAANKRNTIRVEVDGRSQRVPELASQAGLTVSGMWLRVKNGAADLGRGSKRNGWLTFNGVTDTYAGWSRRTGIKASTIAMRITKYGWPVQKALTQGVSHAHS